MPGPLHSVRASGWLCLICSTLPPDTRLCSCFSCQFSSYTISSTILSMQYAQIKLSFILLPTTLFLLTQGFKELRLRIHYVGNLGMTFNFLILLPPSTSVGIGVHQHAWFMTLEIKPRGLWMLDTTLPTELHPSHVVRIPGIFCRIGGWFRPEEEQLDR